jgi:hypothetical protein
MHQYEISAVEHLVEIEPSRLIDHQRQRRVSLAPGRDSGGAVIAFEIARAPPVSRFQYDYVKNRGTSSRSKCRAGMRIAMVPVRAERVAGHDDLGHSREQCGAPGDQNGF